MVVVKMQPWSGWLLCRMTTPGQVPLGFFGAGETTAPGALDFPLRILLWALGQIATHDFLISLRGYIDDFSRPFASCRACKRRLVEKLNPGVNKHDLSQQI
jgi:hypothetical protein